MEFNSTFFTCVGLLASFLLMLDVYIQLNIARNKSDELVHRTQASDKLLLSLTQSIESLEANNRLMANNLSATRIDLARTISFLDITNKSLDFYRKHSLPIGFIYIQLPNQTEPATLWPYMKWTEVSNEYAGLFFRVLGGRSLHFKDIQNEEYPKRVLKLNSDYPFTDFKSKIVTREGTHWGRTDERKEGKTRTIQFRMSDHEVRPRNTAIKLWRRYQ